jgi:hypothetical protein
MFDLKEWRKKWEAMNREDIRLLQKMTIEESVTIYLSLCHSMAPFIDATGDLYLPERKSHLTELQERLRKFGEWKRQQNGHRAEPA